jgi:hypothetical protein
MRWGGIIEDRATARYVPILSEHLYLPCAHSLQWILHKKYFILHIDMKILKQASVLVVSFILVFVWQQTPLADYTVQALGVLVVLFMLASLRRKKWKISGTEGFQPGSLVGDNPYWSVFLVNTLVFLLVFSTGGINSSLFFLLYFVGFGVSLVFEPLLVFVYIIGAILVLLPLTLQDDVMGNAIKVGSIVLFDSIAYLFGKLIRREDEEDKAILALEEEAHQKAADIEKTVVEVLDEEKDTLSDKSVEKLKNVLQDSDDLREDTKLE